MRLVSGAWLSAPTAARIADVARSAFFQRGSTAEQAHAPDRLYDGFHVTQRLGAARDARRSAARVSKTETETRGWQRGAAGGAGFDYDGCAGRAW